MVDPIKRTPGPEDRPRPLGKDSVKLSPELQANIDKTEVAVSHVRLRREEREFTADSKPVGRDCSSLARKRMLPFRLY